MGLLRLDLGRGGGLCAAGADTLVAAVCAHPTLNRIGLHGLDDPDAAQALFTALRRKPQLQELVYTGPLNKEGFEALGKLVEGTSGLLALSLDGCALGPLQMEALAGMVAANRLRELYLANQEFDDAAAGASATAVGKSTALLGLGFRNCAINPEPGARSLSGGVARSKSLLSLELQLSGDAVRDRESVARNFVLAAARSGSLVHFDLQGIRCPGWAQAQERMKRNRLR